MHGGQVIHIQAGVHLDQVIHVQTGVHGGQELVHGGEWTNVSANDRTPKKRKNSLN